MFVSKARIKRQSLEQTHRFPSISLVPHRRLNVNAKIFIPRKEQRKDIKIECTMARAREGHKEKENKSAFYTADFEFLCTRVSVRVHSYTPFCRRPLPLFLLFLVMTFDCRKFKTTLQTRHARAHLQANFEFANRISFKSVRRKISEISSSREFNSKNFQLTNFILLHVT